MSQKETDQTSSMVFPALNDVECREPPINRLKRDAKRRRPTAARMCTVGGPMYPQYVVSGMAPPFSGMSTHHFAVEISLSATDAISVR
jgi:hypothetical protein